MGILMNCALYYWKSDFGFNFVKNSKHIYFISKIFFDEYKINTNKIH